MRHLFFLLFILTGQLCFAQNYSYISYSTSEGLPQSQVFDIAQDEKGYLWIATFGGVAKFNATRFETFSTENGLYNNRVSLVEFIDDTLYLGHEGGISIGQQNSFTNIPLPDEAKTAKVTGILKFNGRIIISTNGGGLFTLNRKIITRVNTTSRYIRDLTVYNNQLYLASRKGLYKIDENLKLNTLVSEEDISFTGFSQGNNKLFVSSYNGNIYSYQNKELKIIYSQPDFKYRGVLYHDNHLWCYSTRGVEKINLNTHQGLILDQTNGLETPNISKVFKDRENNIWFASNGKGLLRFTGETFTYYNKGEKLTSDLVLSIQENDLGQYYFSTFDGGLSLWENDSTMIPLEINGTPVWTSATRKDGDLFFGTNKGIYWRNKSNDKWSRITKNLPPNSQKINVLHPLADNNTILVGGLHGFSRIIGDSLYVDSTLINDRVNIKGFAETKQGLYILGKKSLHLQKGNRTIQVFEKEEKLFTSISQDEKGTIWIGAEQGLYTLKNNDLEEIKLQKSKPNNFVFFLEFFEGKLYIGSNNGLYVYDPKSENITNYGLNEGLIDLEANINSVYVDRKKQLWFGTTSGLMKMDLNKVNPGNSKVKPIVQIGEVKLTKTEKGLNEFCDSITAYGIPVNLSLPYKLNGLNIKLDGLYFSNPKEIEYSYAFASSDTVSWSLYDEGATINFPNLNFGDYTLLVKARANNGVESEIREFHFTIRRPYYFTTWFLTSISLFVLGILLLIVYLNNKRIKTRIARKQYQEQLESRTKLARLEQQSLNASMNRHFIFNSLNSIQYYINANDKLSANRFLTRFAKLIRKNLDSSHEKNGLVKLGDEVERLKLYMDLERMRFTEKFDYKLNVDSGIDLESIDVPAMLLQPFVENSIIHGVLPRHDNLGLIEIYISRVDDAFIVEIRDNGVGIDVSKVNKVSFDGDHNSHGMEITSKRIEILKKLTQRNIELKGPSQINESDGSIKGTSVWIRIDTNNLLIPD